MIKAILRSDLIQISGHANYDEYGLDIVCSSISTAIIMTLNLIELFELSNNIVYDLKEGYFQLLIKLKDDNLEKILNNLKFTVENISKQYPKNVKINK